jgi:hypothetical protein
LGVLAALVKTRLTQRAGVLAIPLVASGIALLWVVSGGAVRSLAAIVALSFDEVVVMMSKVNRCRTAPHTWPVFAGG